MSIGYETVRDRMVKGVREIIEASLWEVSLVTFPANPLARVDSVKASGDIQQEMLRSLRSIHDGMTLTTINLQIQQTAARLQRLRDLVDGSGDQSTWTPRTSDDTKAERQRIAGESRPRRQDASQVARRSADPASTEGSRPDTTHRSAHAVGRHARRPSGSAAPPRRASAPGPTTRCGA